MDLAVVPPARPSLVQLITNAAEHLAALRYAKDTVRHRRDAWRSLQLFAASTGLPDEFSDDLAERFLASRGTSLAGGPATRYARDLRTAMRILSEFGRYGCFHRRHRIPQRVPLSLPMSNALTAYQTYCVTHLRAYRTTMRLRTRTLTLFLHFLEARGAASPGDVRASDVSAFIRSRGHLEPKTISVEASTLRSFFRVGFVLGLLPADLSSATPRIRVRRNGRLPSVWKSEDVEAVLKAVDRASPVGKRDYAMLLLGCRLGMRVGDIRALKLEDVDWRRACLSYRQGKTGTALELPLDDESAGALIDYLRHGRPPTEYREIFLRANAPFAPFGPDDNLHYVLAKYRRAAGVKLPSRCRRGFHSLRHTVASRMLATGVPLEVIGSVLGHASLDATRLYTSVDIDALRDVALEPDSEDGRNG
jgi:integrase